MRSKASSTFHMLLGVLRGLETQETLEGVCRGVTKGTPLGPRPRHAAFCHPHHPSTCKPCLGPGGPTLAWILPRSHQGSDLLHLENMRKGQQPSASGNALPNPCTARPMRGQPTLVHDSLVSTKHGGQCVPALVTLVLCGAECMGFGGLFLFFVCLFIWLVS